MHFDLLLSDIDTSLPHVDITTSIDLIAHVMDFSQAQLSGFDQAVREYVVRRRSMAAAAKGHVTSDSEREQWTKDAQIMAEGVRRGCSRHYEASVAKASKSQLIPEDDRDRFYSAAMALVNTSAKDHLDKRVVDIMEKWPDISGWMCWWATPRIAKLVFGAELSLRPDNMFRLPATSNAVESAHHLLLIGSEGSKLGFSVGLVALGDCVCMFAKMEDAGDGTFPLFAEPDCSANSQM
jgi:hypothetical protein